MLQSISYVELESPLVLVEGVSSWPPHRLHHYCSVVLSGLLGLGVGIDVLHIIRSDYPGWIASIDLVVLGDGLE